MPSSTDGEGSRSFPSDAPEFLGPKFSDPPTLAAGDDRREEGWAAANSPPMTTANTTVTTKHRRNPDEMLAFMEAPLYPRFANG
ncbi:MAG TPA: hypothetical protein VND64_09090, partial [Pirellulales bacterium]|nr:hypothetical protein [Pirellulales bacterium]